MLDPETLIQNLTEEIIRYHEIFNFAISIVAILLIYISIKRMYGSREMISQERGYIRNTILMFIIGALFFTFDVYSNLLTQTIFAKSQLYYDDYIAKKSNLLIKTGILILYILNLAGRIWLVRATLSLLEDFQKGEHHAGHALVKMVSALFLINFGYFLEVIGMDGFVTGDFISW